jgi:hypothetical protein
MQLYGYGVGPRSAEKPDSSIPPRLWERLERLKVSDMKRIVKTQKAPTDDLYYVSAADIADKLIDRMRRGMDPLLFASCSLALLPAGPMSRTYARRKLD